MLLMLGIPCITPSSSSPMWQVCPTHPTPPHLLRVEVRGQYAADVGHGVARHVTYDVILHDEGIAWP